MSYASDTGTRPAARKRRWIRPDLQLKIVLRTMFVAILGLLINFQLSLVGYWLLVQEGSGSAAVSRIPGMLLKYFVVSMGIVVPVGILFTILYTFGFCGPIYRFSQYLQGLVTGRWDRPCVIRKSDDLQDLNETLNSALGVVVGYVQRQHALLDGARTMLTELAGVAQDEGLRERVDVLVGEVDAAAQEHARRFGHEEATSAAEDAPQATAEEPVHESATSG